MEDMDDDDIQTIINHIKTISIFYNPNDFKEYKEKLHIRQDKDDYIYVSKEPITSFEHPTHHSHHKDIDIIDIESLANNENSNNDENIFLKNKRSPSTKDASEDTKKKSKRNCFFCNEYHINRRNLSISKSKSRSNSKSRLKNKHKKRSLSKNLSEHDKDVKEVDCCPLCKWKYPHKMKVKDKNIHVNKCLDGKGQQHRHQYEVNQKIIEMNNKPLVVSEYKNCPVCNRVFKGKSDKAKVKHIIDCLKSFQEYDDYSNKKKSKYHY